MHFLLFFFVLLGVGAAARAQSVLRDGSFEFPAYGTTLNISGAFTLGAWSGWAVSEGGNAGLVRGVDNGLAPLAGVQHFTFNGGNPTGNGGWIEQVFATVAGQQYEVSFGVGRSGGGQQLALQVGVFDGVSLLTGATVGPPGGVGYWVEGFGFVAGSGETRLRFTDVSGGNSISDLYVDNVAVMSAIPEPSTYAAWAGGVAVAAAWWRRRRLNEKTNDATGNAPAGCAANDERAGDCAPRGGGRGSVDRCALGKFAR